MHHWYMVRMHILLVADAASLSAFMTVVQVTDLKNADSTLCGWIKGWKLYCCGLVDLCYRLSGCALLEMNLF